MYLYIKNIDQSYSFLRLLKYSVVLSAFLLIIDILNLPSEYLISYDMTLFLISFGAIFLFLLLTVLEFNFFEIIKLVPINFIDGLSITTIFSCIIYGSVSAIYKQLYFYKFIMIVSVVTIFVAIMLFRGFRLKRSLKIADKYQPNVVDLKEIFTGNFKIKEDKTILVNEKDVDYDLLERENVINQLYNAILRSNPDGRFVISLEGEWGCGKTTIINNVKRKLLESTRNMVIIDEFDPWAYSDQESLFLNMFDIILQKSGLNYSTLSTKYMAENISDNIFGSKKSSIVKSLFKPTNRISDLKNKINEYLKLCEKKVIFFIDNIDRAESENIILLFKLVGNVFDFDRVTYILSFDNERVKRIFENELSIDYQYLKKVVQMQIRVPEVDRGVLNKLCTRCLHNLLIAYGEREENIKDYSCIISYICKQTKDVRDFKRFVNSVVSMPFSEENYLNKRDLLVIGYIRLYNLPLYEKIYKNRIYFISHDKIADSETYSMSFNKKEFNNKAKSFYKDLFSDENNKSYINILEIIFPYVKKYKNNQELEYDRIFFLDEEYSDIVKYRRICSAKYFDLYFTNTKNEFLLIGKLVEDFLDEINLISNLDSRIVTFYKLLKSVHTSYHKEIFERFQFYIEDLKSEAMFDIVNILFNNIHEIDDSPAFFALNARKRVEVIIWELLQKITDEQYNMFLTRIGQQYGKIENISSILYWFEHDKNGKTIDGRKQKMQNLYEEMGNLIINNTISLYDDSYYYPKNIWGLIRLYKDDDLKIKEYIKKIINKSNIFRFLYDIIGLSHGTRFTYSISKQNLEYLTTEENIDEILKDTVPTSKDQQFIYDIYKKYKDGITNEWGETGIVTDEVQNLKL